MNDLKDSKIEDALVGVQFDENGLPVLNGSSQGVEDDHHSISIPLKRENADMVDDGKTYHMTPETPKIEINDEQIFKNIIKRTKKQPITITVNHTIVTVDPTVLAVINDSVQCETEEDKLELLFEEIYDQQEAKRQIFEQFRKVYKQQD